MRLESFSLSLHVVLSACRESLSHVGVSLVFLVYQVVRRCDMVVSISFETSDRVLLLELEVVDQALEELPSIGHFLKSWEKAWLALLRESVLLGCAHVGVSSDIGDTDSSLGVRVEDFDNKVLALR